MKELFTSATIKLTAWYLAILMALSLLFSIVIYQLSTSEINAQLRMFEDRFNGQSINRESSWITKNNEAFRIEQLHEAEINLVIGLLYTNLVIIVVGGLGSYVLARRTLEPIEASHEAQARFTSDASHELRTPLAVMKSELEVALRSTSLTKPEMRELLESNLEEVNRLSILSTTLLKLSRNTTSPIMAKKVQLLPEIESAANHRSFQRKRIFIDIPKQLNVRADQTLLQEVFIILLDNAHRYSPPDSPITVNAKRHRDITTIRISNTGKGIAKDVLPYVFDRFYRGDKSRTTQNDTTQGYGLGLSLAKQIIEANGGTIEIKSTPHKSTSVIFTLKS